MTCPFSCSSSSWFVEKRPWYLTLNGNVLIWEVPCANKSRNVSLPMSKCGLPRASLQPVMTTSHFCFCFQINFWEKRTTLSCWPGSVCVGILFMTCVFMVDTILINLWLFFKTVLHTTPWQKAWLVNRQSSSPRLSLSGLLLSALDVVAGPVSNWVRRSPCCKHATRQLQLGCPGHWL